LVRSGKIEMNEKCIFSFISSTIKKMTIGYQKWDSGNSRFKKA
jgi:hypothetical protein